eukprot:g26758.t1
MVKVDFLFGFADLSDKAEMQMRDAAASSTAAPEGEKYRPSSCEPETLPEEPDLRRRSLRGVPTKGDRPCHGAERV